MGRDHMWLMMHMYHPIYCPGCSNGVESAGHEIDTPPQTPKIGKRGLLCDDKRLCIEQKNSIVHAKNNCRALGKCIRFLVPHIDVGSIINDAVTHLSEY
jgi:hypothetical protein